MEFKWKKLGRVFDPQTVTGRLWLQEYAQAPDTLVFDNFVRVYFSCRPHPDHLGNYVSYSSYLELDRKDLFKINKIADEPVLSPGGLGEFDEFGAYPISVIRYRDTVRGYYGGWTRGYTIRYNTCIGMAMSFDEGEHFTKYGRGPVISYSPFEPFNIGSMKIRKYNDLFYMFYTAGKSWKVIDGRTEPVYHIRMAVSKNGIENWELLGSDLIETVYPEEAQSGPDVIYLDGVYHMFFCYRRSYDYSGKEGGLRIGYAWSRDLYQWCREDDKAGITVSEEGWDSEMVRYPHVFELDGEIYMLYNGNDFGKNGFGLAILER